MSKSLTVGLFGGLGGAANAWLCFAERPVAIKDDPVLHWHVIPAGAAHGAILAASAFGIAEAVRSKRVVVRLGLAAPLAWVAGYVSWIPLNRSVFDEPWAKTSLWPFDAGALLALYRPLPYFGLVALVYYLCLCFRKSHDGLGTHLLAAVSAGILGSLWWWIGWEPWFFSLLHGTLWGVLVGFGAWKASVGARRRREPRMMM